MKPLKTTKEFKEAFRKGEEAIAKSNELRKINPVYTEKELREDYDRIRMENPLSPKEVVGVLPISHPNSQKTKPLISK